jgi:plastocyanin
MPSHHGARATGTPARALAGAVAVIAVAGAAVLGLAAIAATPATAAGSTTATVTWSNGSFSGNPRLHAGDAVRWRNNSGQPLEVKGTTSNWKAYSVTVAANATSASHKFTTAGSYGFSGTGGLLGTQTDSGTITVTAPQSSPTPSKTPTSKPSPHTSKPASSPPPKHPTRHHHQGGSGSNSTPSPTFTGGVGAAGGPQLGAGELNPPVRPGHGNAPDPVVASPGVTPTPAPTASVDAFGDPVTTEATLAQPVPARRFGLPGAVAAVLVAGVIVGVVRLARAEYGTE